MSGPEVIVGMFQRFPQERISEASLTGRERPIPSVSNLRVFDNVQIPEKIADQVQITLNRTGDQVVDASIPHPQEILERRKFSR